MPVIADTPDYQIVRTVSAAGFTDQVVLKPGPAKTRIDNGDAIRAKALAALTANTTYLAVGAPTNPQVVAQVDRLTRECSALIRLMLDQVDDITGT
jgi:hypothetical protein